MVSDQALVHYTCIAHNHDIESPDSTILAEFNMADSSLQDLAQQCLHRTPPHHTIYSQTYRKQTYTFVLDYPFVYFGIFDKTMVEFDQINLLERLKETFNHIIKKNPNRKLTSYCLQGELHPIYHHLVSKSLHFDGALIVAPPNDAHNNNDHVSSGSSRGRKIMTLPMFNSSKIGNFVYNNNNNNNKKKKKKKISDESNMDSKEALVGNVNVIGVVKSREINLETGVFLMIDGHGRQNKAKKIWRRHIWIVLMLDLGVCLILFGIWLSVCRGFQCIDE